MTEAEKDRRERDEQDLRNYRAMRRYLIKAHGHAPYSLRKPLSELVDQADDLVRTLITKLHFPHLKSEEEEKP